MKVREQLIISDHLDENGVRQGDRVFLTPLMGRKSQFTINRTCIDFLSDDLVGKVESNFFKPLGSQKNESFHVQIKKITTIGRSQVTKDRYIAKTLCGDPFRLNGVYSLESYLEEGDCLEIGFNKLRIKRTLNDLDFDSQKKTILENKKIVRSTLPILIKGETGVGKTSLAYKIHKESLRVGRFVHLNISSFSLGLVESELFGHVKGAFTGAVTDKRGAFREADKGTLFIDEVDSLPLEIQTKLLLFLDSFSARPVGGTIDYKVDVRVLFSSGPCLEQLVQQEKMRKDFFFRISSGQQFVLKPLREEPELIEVFCNFFIMENEVSISKKLIDFYKTLPWAGNYRQLKGHLERKVVLSGGQRIDFDQTDEELIEQSSNLLGIKNVEEVSSLQEVKVAYAKKIFYQCGQNYTSAASKLHIGPRSLKGLIFPNSQL